VSLKKLEHLKSIIKEMSSVLVAFSGGTDSTFLLKVAVDVLKEKAVALTATSPTYPFVEYKNACALAEEFGVRHIIIESNELEIKNFAANNEKRCYYCKSELFTLAAAEAAKIDIRWVADGSNADDLKDYRPGREAAREKNVRSPLVEANLSKEEIRSLSRQMGVKTWDRPASACLSSRFPYGTKITPERVMTVEKCENILREKGFRQFRVRFHGDVARIETTEEEFSRFFEDGLRHEIIEGFKEAGFIYTSLDLQGYRTGSLNEAIRKKAPS